MLRAGHSWDEIGRVLFGFKRPRGTEARGLIGIAWGLAGEPGGPGPYPAGAEVHSYEADMWRAARWAAIEQWLLAEAERELEREAIAADG